jgi:(+)-trans-carveol dehydrogenase
MGKLDNKVAFITGAARGQGRSHAVRLASEGADIIAIDICGPVATSIAPPSTPADLEETVRLVEKLDRRIVATQADVRDYDALSEALDNGIAELGRLDIVVANAAIWNLALTHELTEAAWRDVIDIGLTGVWHTCKAVVPTLLKQDEGGSIILTSSAAGVNGFPQGAHYVAAKHGVIGLMKTMANELGQYRIRVNTVNPGTVNTPFMHNAPTYKYFTPDLDNPTEDQILERFQSGNLLPYPWVEPADVSAMVAFLASDEARHITGTTMFVDNGAIAHT